jgi:hypothetical protein
MIDLTLKSWLATSAITGDLTTYLRDCAAELPDEFEFKNRDHMRRYLQERNASPEVIAEIPRVWPLYRSWQDRQAKRRFSGKPDRHMLTRS